MDNKEIKFSIVIVTYAREKEYFECASSLIKQQIPYTFETIVVFNGDSSYLHKSIEQHPYFIYLTTDKTTPAQARNVAISRTQGEFIFFLDDDCLIPDGYFNKINFNTGWDVLGGPDQTPPLSSSMQASIGRALSSPLCMGPTFYRHSKEGRYLNNANERKLILCNLWIRRSLLLENNLKFNKDLFRNEENFLLKEIHKFNANIHYDPQLYIHHKRRSNLRAFGGSIFKSGECRIQSFFLLPSREELLYLLPLVFVPFFLILTYASPKLSGALMIAYLTLTIGYSLKKEGHISPLFSLLHLFILGTYALGSLFGLYKALLVETRRKP